MPTKLSQFTNDSGYLTAADVDTSQEHTHANKTVLDKITQAMLDKLAGIAEGANKYVHPTTAGNKHVPSGGSSGQILRWSADGTAAWGRMTIPHMPYSRQPPQAPLAGLVWSRPQQQGRRQNI